MGTARLSLEKAARAFRHDQLFSAEDGPVSYVRKDDLSLRSLDLFVHAPSLAASFASCRESFSRVNSINKAACLIDLRQSPSPIDGLGAPPD